MFKKILIGVAAVIVILVIVVLVQPAKFRITRAATMNAKAVTVFEQINDFHKWNDWSPWAKMDPACKFSFEGKESGPGAIFKWAGNDKVGEGMMTILESKPGAQVKIKLEFIKPFAAINTSEFTLKENADKTDVSWSMYGKNGFVGKAFSLIMNCDKMVGPDFEKGLANLKAIVEAPPKPKVEEPVKK